MNSKFAAGVLQQRRTEASRSQSHSRSPSLRERELPVSGQRSAESNGLKPSAMPRAKQQLQVTNNTNRRPPAFKANEGGGDHLIFKRKMTDMAARIEEAYAGTEGSEEKLDLDNIRTTESTIRQISKPTESMTESTMRSNQPPHSLLAQVPPPGKTHAQHVLFTLGNTGVIDNDKSEGLPPGRSPGAYDAALQIKFKAAQLGDDLGSSRFLNQGFHLEASQPQQLMGSSDSNQNHTTTFATANGENRLAGGLGSSGHVNTHHNTTTTDSERSGMSTPVNSQILSQIQSQIQSRIQTKEHTLKNLQQRLNQINQTEGLDSQRRLTGGQLPNTRNQINLTRISEERQGQSTSQYASASQLASVKSKKSEISENLSRISKVNDNSLSQFFNQEELQLLNMKFEQISPPEEMRKPKHDHQTDLQVHQFSFKKQFGQLDASFDSKRGQTSYNRELEEQATNRSFYKDDKARSTNEHQPRRPEQESNATAVLGSQQDRLVEAQDSRRSRIPDNIDQNYKGSFERGTVLSRGKRSQSGGRQNNTPQQRRRSSTSLEEDRSTRPRGLKASVHSNESRSRSTSRNKVEPQANTAAASNQNEYMRIYEDLLNEALQQQTQSLKEVDNDLYRSTGNMIARATTKSFRELCQKLLQQNKELIQYAITASKDTKVENEKHKHERQQLKLEINQKEQKAQSYLAQLTQAQEQQTRQDTKLQQLKQQISQQRQKEQQHLQDMYQSKQTKSQYEDQIKQLNWNIKEMQEQCKLSEELHNKQKKLDMVDQRQYAADSGPRGIVAIDMDPVLQSKFNLEPYLNPKLAPEQFKHFYDIIKMVDAENEKLKQKIRQQADEKSGAVAEAEQQVVCLQEYIENIKQMFNKKLLAQKSTMDEMGSLYEASEAKLKAKIAECSSLSNQVYGSVAGVQSLTDEKLMLRKNLSEVKAQLNKAIADKDALEQQTRTLTNECCHLKSQNDVYEEQIEGFRAETTLLQGVDVQILLQMDFKGRVMKSRERLPKNQDMPLLRNSLYDSVNSFNAQFQGVTTYAQAINQAQQIEKFLKMDRAQKKQIKELKANLHEFCTDFDKIDAKIKAVVTEKESLEAVLLELVGFSESCDDRFDQIIDKITKFSDQDRKEFEEMKNGHELIRIQLSETVKNIIVEIEDHEIRDELLSVLTDINDKPLNLTVGQLVEKLVQRMRDLHLKNKRLYTINTEQAREAKQAQEQLTAQNQQLASENQMNEKLIRDIDILSQRIIIKISDSQMKFNMPNSPQTFSSEIDILERAQMPLNTIFGQINLALGLISEWTVDQMVQMPIHKKNMELLLQKTNAAEDRLRQKNESYMYLETNEEGSKEESKVQVPAIAKNQKMLLQEILNKVTGLRSQTEATTERDDRVADHISEYRQAKRPERRSEPKSLSQSRSGSHRRSQVHTRRGQKITKEQSRQQHVNEYEVEPKSSTIFSGQSEHHGLSRYKNHRKSSAAHVQQTNPQGYASPASFEEQCQESDSQYTSIRQSHTQPSPDPLIKERRPPSGDASVNAQTPTVVGGMREHLVVTHYKSEHLNRPRPPNAAGRLKNGGRHSQGSGDPDDPRHPASQNQRTASRSKPENESQTYGTAGQARYAKAAQQEEQRSGQYWTDNRQSQTERSRERPTTKALRHKRSRYVNAAQASGANTPPLSPLPLKESPRSQHSHPLRSKNNQKSANSNGMQGHQGHHSSRSRSRSASNAFPVSTATARADHRDQSKGRVPSSMQPRALRLKELPQGRAGTNERPKRPLHVRSQSSHRSQTPRQSRSLSNCSGRDRSSLDNKVPSRIPEAEFRESQASHRRTEQRYQKIDSQRQIQQAHNHSSDGSRRSESYFKGSQKSCCSRDMQHASNPAHGLALGTLGEGLEPSSQYQAHSLHYQPLRRGSQDQISQNNDSIMTVPQQDLSTLYSQRQDQFERQSQKSSKTTVRRFPGGAQEERPQQYGAKGAYQSIAARKIAESCSQPFANPSQMSGFIAAPDERMGTQGQPRNAKQALDEKLSKQFDSLEQERRLSREDSRVHSKSATPERQDDNHNLFNRKLADETKPAHISMANCNSQSITTLPVFQTLQPPTDASLTRSKKSKSQSNLQTLQERYPEKLQKIGQLLENQQKLLKISGQSQFDSQIYHNQNMQALLRPHGQHQFAGSLQMLDSNQEDQLMSQQELSQIQRSYGQIAQDFKKAQGPKTRDPKGQFPSNTAQEQTERKHRAPAAGYEAYRTEEPRSVRVPQQYQIEIEPIIKYTHNNPNIINIRTSPDVLNKEEGHTERQYEHLKQINYLDFPTFQQNTENHQSLNASSQPNSLSSPALGDGQMMIEESRVFLAPHVKFTQHSRSHMQSQVAEPEQLTSHLSQAFAGKRQSLSRLPSALPAITPAQAPTPRQHRRAQGTTEQSSQWSSKFHPAQFGLQPVTQRNSIQLVEDCAIDCTPEQSAPRLPAPDHLRYSEPRFRDQL